jgi:hypothetical protein
MFAFGSHEFVSIFSLRLCAALSACVHSQRSEEWPSIDIESRFHAWELWDGPTPGNFYRHPASSSKPQSK